MSENSEEKSKVRKPYTGAGIAIGAAVGVALGVVFDQLALGLALGTALGAAIDVVSHVRHKDINKTLE
ncbi:MAG: glycine zipper family protein [Chloroflexi bacterium]|nr:glycine zipper family protein [Chloroflexota bacterium]